MPYRTNADLPDRVRTHLPKHAQDIFRETFNHAYETYADPRKRRGGGTREAVANRVAWSAVKSVYRKQNGHWVKV